MKDECRIIPLVVNYRSNSDIVDFYNEWMDTTSEWYLWNGKYWEQDNGTVIEYAIHCVRSIYSINEDNVSVDVFL